MSDYVYLVMVNPNENNNKFYEMKENGDGTFTASYGRVEGGKQSKTYNMGRWDAILRAKTRKGYRDQTKAHAVEDSATPPTDSRPQIISDSNVVSDIFRYLQDAATRTISRNYNMKAQNVTQDMIDDAQDSLNELAILYKGADWGRFNSTLLDLFHIIPRKMGKVADYILDLSEGNLQRLASEMVTLEQELLDAMKGQVVISTANTSDATVTKNLLFDSMGIVPSDVSTAETKMIKRLLGRNANQFNGAVTIFHKATQKKFDNYVEGKANEDTDLLWHGSRNENWISIMTSGLVLNPTNAVITGKMFGEGLYFANKAQKSLGYSSLRGSYWSNGNQNRGYLALFDVHMGNSWNVQRHSSEHYQLTGSKMERKGYDSLFARGGADLRNDEIIVYNQNACTVKYLVDLR